MKIFYSVAVASALVLSAGFLFCYFKSVNAYQFVAAGQGVIFRCDPITGRVSWALASSRSQWQYIGPLHLSDKDVFEGKP